MLKFIRTAHVCCLTKTRGWLWSLCEGFKGCRWRVSYKLTNWIPLFRCNPQWGKPCQAYMRAQGALNIQHKLGGKSLVLVINETLTPQKGKACLAGIRVWGKPINRSYFSSQANIFLDV